MKNEWSDVVAARIGHIQDLGCIEGNLVNGELVITKECEHFSDKYPGPLCLFGKGELTTYLYECPMKTKGVEL